MLNICYIKKGISERYIIERQKTNQKIDLKKFGKRAGKNKRKTTKIMFPRKIK